MIVAAGRDADLVVLGSNPLVSLDAPNDLQMIVNDGEIAFGRRD